MWYHGLVVNRSDPMPPAPSSRPKSTRAAAGARTRAGPARPADIGPPARVPGSADPAGAGTHEEGQERAVASTTLAPLLKDGSERSFRTLIVRLMSLVNLMRRNQERFGEFIGVSLPQFQMLVVVNDNPGLTIGDIASRLEVTSPFVTAEIGKLVAQGVVEKRQSAEDRRVVHIHLTDHGFALIRELGPLRRRTNDLMFGSLTAERAALLYEMVDMIVSDGRQANHELDGPDRRNQRAPSLQARLRAGDSERGKRGRG